MVLTLDSLPSDVPMKICRHILKGTEDIHPDSNNARFENDMPTGKPSGCLPILLTCKLLHEEAASVPYSEHIFKFTEQPIGTIP